MSEQFIRVVDCDLDQPLTIADVAEIVGARPTLISRLVRLGVLETISDESEEPMLRSRSVLRLRRMARLRRDLGVNFAGAAVIVDLVDRIEELNRDLADMHSHHAE
jgi:MerR HTH family regulatory protein